MAQFRYLPDMMEDIERFKKVRECLERELGSPNLDPALRAQKQHERLKIDHRLYKLRLAAGVFEPRRLAP